MAYILAGVSYNRALNQRTGDVIFTTQTTQENGMSISVTEEEIRGGMSNKKLGSYFHDSVMTANITDALFDLRYLSSNLGSVVNVGADIIKEETITTVVANTITVTDTPVQFLNISGVIGWYTVAGQNDWKVMTFNGKDATVSNLAQGTKVCVKYPTHSDSARSFTVSATIIPDEVIWEMHYPLFKGNETSFTTSSKVGELIVTVPRFLFSGSQELNITSSGAATTALSGSALAYFAGTGCNDDGDYAYITENIYNKNWYEDLEAMAVDGAEIAMTTAGGTKTLKVYGVYTGGATGVINNANLTFTSGTTATCTVGANTGIITPVASGKSIISITATGKPTIDCYAEVTVS